MLAELNESNTGKHKDPKIKEFIDKIVVVPEEIRRATLTFYVRRCRDIHMIAFF